VSGSASSSQATRLRDRLAGEHILITGSTGFLAKAFVEKLLRSVDTVGGLHLLVRGRSGGATASQRVEKEVLRSHAFDRLRASLGDAFDAMCKDKVHVVSGDLVKERFGLSPDDYAALADNITLVVNSAATVTFDERLDEAVDLNTLGPSRLLQFTKDAGNVPFLHVSTCYVCGARNGAVIEDLSAPEVAREMLPRQKDSGDYDLDKLISNLQDESNETCERLGTTTEACRRELIDSGMRWSRRFGWNDTYTFTKWVGEQLLVRDRGDVPLVIFRPAIIEGSYDEPLPGWIDGLRMADPIIVAYGRGKLEEFPADINMPLDLIPADFVANAMIAALPVGDGRRGDVCVYQSASSDRNPLMIPGVMRGIEDAFRRRPMLDDDGKPIHPAKLKAVRLEPFVKRWNGKRKLVTQIQKWMMRFGMKGRRYRKFSAVARQIDQLIYFAKIYSPYTHLDCRFSDDNLRAVADALHPVDRKEFPFDPKVIDWYDYLVNRHIPGLRRFVLGTSGEPGPRILGIAELRDDPRGSRSESADAENIFAAFATTAERFGDKPAFQIRRNNRWLRYSYEEAYNATGTILQRLAERGITAGDRVAICGENGPEWALLYLALMRGGMTAIPLDPQLAASDAWSGARFASAKLLCAGKTTLEGLQTARLDGDVEVVLLTAPFIPPPAVSRDVDAPPVDVREDAIASILFTSGTTIAPKAVPLTHANLLSNARSLLEVHDIGATDEFLSVLPMYHAFEFTGGLLVPIVCGATITYIEQLKGAEITSAMKATGTTVMLVVPRLVKLFNDSIHTKVAASNAAARAAFRTMGKLSDWSGGALARPLFGKVHEGFGGHLRMLVSGGSSLDPELFRSFTRMGFSVYEGYGLTETSPVLTVHRAGDSKPGTVGSPVPNIELDIRNQNLEGVGEIWVKGPSVMSGYLDNDEATREVIQDDWFRTGDLGRCDADGHICITGRSKDLIITGAGKNVYPDEVESHYQDLPHTKELCVFGVPSDDGMGDAVHAVVVLDEDSAPNLDRSSREREIREAAAEIAESIATYQHIATIHFWDRELPKTTTMKAKRGAIREAVLAEQKAPSESQESGDLGKEAMAAELAVSDEAFSAIREILSQQSNRDTDAIRADMHLLLDLGIDSIGKIDAMGSIEARFGMQIDDVAAANVARVADLLRLVGDRQPRGKGDTSSKKWKKLAASSTNGANGFSGDVPLSAKPFRWFARGTVGVLMNTYIRVRGVGAENLPKTGAFILAPNHSSHLDSPSVMTAIGSRRRVWVAGAEDYFFNTAIKRFVFGKLFDTIPFDRKADGVAGLRRCGDALSHGDGLLLFPEGTRSVTGELQKFRIGIAVLAVERQVPIVPVHIDRAYDLLRKGGRIVRPGMVTVRFGKPIPPPPADAIEDHYTAFRELTQTVQEAVALLAREAQAR
jgi:long-chain acyl-CoA synthetase